MKKKINRYLLLTVFLSLSTTLLMAIAVFHHMYREQIIEDMKTYGEVSKRHDIIRGGTEGSLPQP